VWGWWGQIADYVTKPRQSSEIPQYLDSWAYWL